MKTAKDQTNEYLQDIITSQERVAELNERDRPMDAVVEVVVSLIFCCIIFSGLGLLYWYQENDGTDTGVGCIDDCLELEVTK